MQKEIEISIPLSRCAISFCGGGKTVSALYATSTRSQGVDNVLYIKESVKEKVRRRNSIISGTGRKPKYNNSEIDEDRKAEKLKVRMKMKRDRKRLKEGRSNLFTV